MIQFIDGNKYLYGIELICRVLPITPSTYHHAKYSDYYPEQRSLRIQYDEFYLSKIRSIWKDSKCRYSTRKICQQMKANGLEIALCTVERLMKHYGLQRVGVAKAR